ncbi:MAG: hypothetical protein WAT71_13875 [Ignavibacteria bacterium]
MKTSKLVIALVIFVSQMVVTGCNDNLTSTIVSNSDKSQQLKSNIDGEDFYSATISLQPGESVFLDSNVTSLSGINSYSISNCSLLKKTVFISTSVFDPPGSMECEWETYENYLIPDLSIQNISRRKMNVEVLLNGVSVK